MTKDQFTAYFNDLVLKLSETTRAGQSEYARGFDVFDNFNRLSSDLELEKKKVLWVYLKKHLDGILSHINGRISQRESVHGRIQDAIVYLILLDAMVSEEEKNTNIINNSNSIIT